MSWLVVTQDAQPRPPSPRQVLDAMDDYTQALSRLREDWGADTPWSYLVQCALDVARDKGWIP